MYVVKQDQKTDYAQPPMSEAYYGVLERVSLVHLIEHELTESIALVGEGTIILPSVADCQSRGCRLDKRTTLALPATLCRALQRSKTCSSR